MGGVQWGPAVGVLALGLVLGALVLWRAARAQMAPATAGLPPPDVRDLLSRRDVLIEQLREIEESSKRTPAQKAMERPPLELEAARVLLALDQRAAALTAAPAETAAVPLPQGVLAARPALRGFLWGVGSMAAVAALVYLVTDASRPRAAGEGVTGGMPGPPGAARAAEPASPEEAELLARLAQNPDDVEARIALAGRHLAAHDLMAVWNDTQAVLTRHPDEPRALSYQALVRVEMGQPEIALEMLKKALAKAPDMAAIHVHLMLVYSRMGRQADAEATLAAAVQRFPEDAEALRGVMEEIRRAGTAPPAEEAALPPEHPANASESAPSGGLEGVLELDPAVAASVPPGVTVFVTVRAAGVTQGPPVAAKRLSAAGFPLRFTVSAADSMMGQALPERLRVEARVDRDGDPLSRAPEDPVARMDDVSAGTRDLRLVLRRE
jgi:tetratricopeptide (TPR) repeat protein